MRLVAAALVALAIGATPVMGQTADPPFPVAGTVIKVAPLFVPREESHSLVIILPLGTEVQVLGRQGVWYRVAFSSPQGDHTGLMEPHDVQIAADAVSLSSERDMAAVSEDRKSTRLNSSH